MNELYKDNEFNILPKVADILNMQSSPSELLENLEKTFHELDLDKVSVYIYDENTKTLKNFAKSWVVIDEFHKNAYADKLYLALAQFGKYDFFVNAEAFKFDTIEKVQKTTLEDVNTILFPLRKNSKPYGLVVFDFSRQDKSFLTDRLFSTLLVAAQQISLKVQNSILIDQMQVNIDFHDSMKNIAKIIETQYELNYIIPIIGEMIDRFISEHLIYVFLKNEETGKFELFWPKSCRDKKILSAVSKITAKSKYVLSKDEKMGIFPLVGEKSLLGCVVAYSNIDKLNKKEIEYLEQLTKQSSITIHRANVYAEVLQHATLDALTGLNNRRQFEVRIKQEVATAKRQNKPLCAMMIDVDFFKKVNDTYGHVAGDLVLKTVAGIIKDELREYDIPSRYGGEEFSVLLPYTKIEEAFAVAQRLRQAVEAKTIEFVSDDEPVNKIKVTVSIGVNQYKKDDTEQDLYDKADKALYDAKTHGRNKVVIFK